MGETKSHRSWNHGALEKEIKSQKKASFLTKMVMHDCMLSVRSIVSTLQPPIATRAVPCWFLMCNKARTVQSWRVRIRTFAWHVAFREIHFWQRLFLICKMCNIAIGAGPSWLVEVHPLPKRLYNTKTLSLNQSAGSRTSVFFHQAWKKAIEISSLQPQ